MNVTQFTISDKNWIGKLVKITRPFNFNNGEEGIITDVSILDGEDEFRASVKLSGTTNYNYITFKNHIKILN